MTFQDIKQQQLFHPQMVINYLVSLPWKPVLQRLPGVLLLVLLNFALFGPIYFPILFSLHLLILHLLFLAGNLRVTYAVYFAYRAAREHSITNWYKKYLIETGQHDDSVQVMHDGKFLILTHR
jgi:hypothetical protein